jgi:hypothetical protein
MLRSIRRALAAALAVTSTALAGRTVAGCCDCGAHGVHTMAFEPNGFPWARCKACTDRLFDDDEMLSQLAEDGVVWTYLPGAPVFDARAINEQMDDLRAHGIPFFPPVSA